MSRLSHPTCARPHCSPLCGRLLLPCSPVASVLLSGRPTFLPVVSLPDPVPVGSACVGGLALSLSGVRHRRFPVTSHLTLFHRVPSLPVPVPVGSACLGQCSLPCSAVGSMSLPLSSDLTVFRCISSSSNTCQHVLYVAPAAVN